MNIRKPKLSRGSLFGIIAVVLSITALVFASSYVYWSRTIQYSFKVVGLNAELLIPDYADYAAQNQASNLTSSNQVALTILKENFYSIWLNITAIANTSGVVVSCTGQYYYAQVNYGVSGEYTFVPYNSTIFTVNMNTTQTIDKVHMMYNTPSLPTGGATVGTPGYCLVLTFSFNTELVTTPGNYGVALTFQMGFV